MTLKQAQKTCQEIDAQYSSVTQWDKIFNNEIELENALGNIFIPNKRIAPPYTFKGYEYIYSFAYYIKQGWKLSDNQMRQAKRLALEIKKASMIAEYTF